MRADPFAAWRLGWATWRLLAEAQAVVALRMLGMMGVVPRRPGEDRRMVAEKGPAFARGAAAAGAAALAGRGPEAVAAAGLRPIRRRVSANAKRLSKPRRPRG